MSAMNGSMIGAMFKDLSSLGAAKITKKKNC